MVICHPKVSCINVSGFEVFNPSIQVLIPKVFGEISFQGAGATSSRDETRPAHDAVLLVLEHLRLDLLSELVNGIQREVKSRELVATAAVVGTAEIVPSGFVGNFDFRPIGGKVDGATTLKKQGAGMRGHEIHHRHIEIDGNQIRDVKALFKVFGRIKLQNKALNHKKCCVLSSL